MTMTMTTERDHPAQLLVCHQKIARPHVIKYAEETYQFCSLSAYAWCFDCGYYVCDIHQSSRHVAHRTVVEYPHNAMTPVDTAG